MAQLTILGMFACRTKFVSYILTEGMLAEWNRIFEKTSVWLVVAVDASCESVFGKLNLMLHERMQVAAVPSGSGGILNTLTSGPMHGRFAFVEPGYSSDDAGPG